MIKSRAMLRLAMLSALVLSCTSLPVPVPDPNPSPALDDRPEIIEIIAPAQAAQETLDSLNFGEPNAEASDRSKRTIGILRQLFPNLSQIIDQKIQAIVSFLIRTVGRTLLTGALGGGGGNNGGTSGDSDNKVSIDLPSFDSDEDDEEEDETDNNDNDKAVLPSIGSRAKEDNDTAADAEDSTHEVQTSKFEDTSSIEPTTANTPSNNEVHTKETTINNSSSSTDNEISSTESISSPNLTSETMDSSLSSTLESVTTTVKDPTTIVSPVTAADNTDSDNQLAGAESQHNEVRVQFADEDGQKDAAAEGDQDGAASDTDGLALDDIDSPDETRDKRSGFGGGDSGSGSSGGGSGNFLFDIIRRPAENMARAAGQAFRILTGTDSIGLGITATHTATRDIDSTNKLVAGSGGTEQNDEASNATDDSDGTSGKAEAAYGEGIPGPVTRLFIIANRGIANLIQDLILRLAHTSERIVNFKARLITSII